MRVLVLGGTGFVGRAIVAALRSGGAATTLFNRGRAPSAPGLVGDRDTGDYTALAGRRFDAVVDVSGYLPRHVREASGALGDRVGRYLFISSHAVFDGGSAIRRPPVRDAAPPLTDATYGPSKVACEDEVLVRYGPRATIVRPGKVAGPHNNQDQPVGARPTQRRDAVPGFCARPLAETVADVLAWDRERGEPPLRRGFTDAAESRVLRTWTASPSRRRAPSAGPR